MNVQLEGSQLFDKVFGCLIGGAIGDALGGPVEGMDYRFIRKLWGGPITDLQPYERPDDFFQPGEPSYAKSPDAGNYTDDTRLKHLLCGALIEAGGRITADDLAQYWMRHMDPDEYWVSIQASYYRLALGQTPARLAGAGNVPDNSSAMCIAPVGIVNAGDPRQAALDAYDLASLSHDGYSREAASLVAAAVAEAMRPEASVDSIVKAAMDCLPHPATSLMRNPMEKGISLAEECRDSEELTERFYEELIVPWRSYIEQYSQPDDERHSTSVDPLESVPCALAMFYVSNGEFKATVTAAASFGRDCDTIATMAGSIAGAYNGALAIPDEWVEQSLATNPDPDQRVLARMLTEAVLAETAQVAGRVASIDHQSIVENGGQGSLGGWVDQHQD